METMLVRVRPYDPRRGSVLRRYTYRGIKFLAERGWYRVAPDVAEYLRTVRQTDRDAHAPLAFDVCTEAEARAIDEKERSEKVLRTAAGSEIPLTPARAGAERPGRAADATPDVDARPGRRGKERQ